ncbi:hypothetical protein JI721_16730 [Alicyclobacillus cycloheptanicus]|uniref:Multidrug transporter n=1 Tax=Alicyclobacillus cycloheptanicus TaxID=1457 RepID=A0ABT9XE62_9BACL|nr:hypothetical protein [Alicyclobacillus cycloheptanicus]MDQ0188591.1 hypothetical protein [Alicyclobacillus cycloheptanicus]WDM01272.1 hypothetical protein JI721_16730 [Alicyclobacillus cycloheptanicus]
MASNRQENTTKAQVSARADQSDGVAQSADQPTAEGLDADGLVETREQVSDTLAAGTTDGVTFLPNGKTRVMPKDPAAPPHDE